MSHSDDRPLDDMVYIVLYFATVKCTDFQLLWFLTDFSVYRIPVSVCQYNEDSIPLNSMSIYLLYVYSMSVMRTIYLYVCISVLSLLSFLSHRKSINKLIELNLLNKTLYILWSIVGVNVPI